MSLYSILSLAALLTIAWQQVESPATQATSIRLAGRINGPTAKLEMDRLEFASMAGKWRVTSVERDGPPNQTQLGQRVGDVITLNWNGGRPYAL